MLKSSQIGFEILMPWTLTLLATKADDEVSTAVYSSSRYSNLKQFTLKYLEAYSTVNLALPVLCIMGYMYNEQHHVCLRLVLYNKCNKLYSHQ